MELTLKVVYIPVENIKDAEVKVLSFQDNLIDNCEIRKLYTFRKEELVELLENAFNAGKLREEYINGEDADWNFIPEDEEQYINKLFEQ